LTAKAKDAGTGTASNLLSADYAAFGPATLTFNPGDGSSIDSTTATLTSPTNRRLEGNETVNLFIDTLSSTLDGHVSLSDTTHTATILDNETGVINFLATSRTLKVCPRR
jgi:hypothetical protein